MAPKNPEQQAVARARAIHMAYYDDLARMCETLVARSVFEKIPLPYQRSWIREVNAYFTLLVRIRRRTTMMHARQENVVGPEAASPEPSP